MVKCPTFILQVSASGFRRDGQAIWSHGAWLVVKADIVVAIAASILLLASSRRALAGHRACGENSNEAADSDRSDKCALPVYPTFRSRASRSEARRGQHGAGGKYR